MEKIAYQGWNNCIRLSNGIIELVITADVGPRVIRFGFIGAQNEFDEDWLGVTGGDVAQQRDGKPHRKIGHVLRQRVGRTVPARPAATGSNNHRGGPLPGLLVGRFHAAHRSVGHIRHPGGWAERLCLDPEKTDTPFPGHNRLGIAFYHFLQANTRNTVRRPRL